MNSFRCITLVLVFSLISVLNAQNKDTLAFNNYLKGGRWALQFELGTYINTSFLKNVEISLKPQLSRSSAIRLGTSVDLYDRSGESNEFLVAGEDNSSSVGFIVDLNYIHYINPEERVCFYFGIGPLYEYDYNKYDNVNANSSNGYTFKFEYHTSKKEIYYGGTGLLGMEWFLIERISLIAEYNLAVKYGKSDETRTNISTYAQEPTEYDVKIINSNIVVFQFNIVKLGLSVYF